LDLSIDVKAHSIEDLFAMRKRVNLQVKTLLEKSAAAMKTHADSRRRDTSWTVGDAVLLSTAHLPLRAGARKLAEKWTGPFTVVSQVSANAWRLQLPP
jgi:hypothetical protein